MYAKACWSPLVAAIAAAGCATAPISEHRVPLRPGDHYVAMGSSFAAGAGIGPIKPDTPVRCQRTNLNYASLLAERLRLDLTDVTCGGATTAHVLGGWNELPPQLDALTPRTRLVTITIGGNDLAYVRGLIGGACRAGASTTSGSCIQNELPSDAAYAELEQNLRAVAIEIAERAPRARLVFVQYITLVPETPCDLALLTPEDASISRTIGLRLAEITGRVAEDRGALVLPADELSRSHTACDAEPWNSGMSRAYDLSRGAPWHPTSMGMRAIADALASYVAP